MRIVFFGTPDFAVPTLQKLIDHPAMTVVGVVTQPDTRRGRGKQFSPSPIKALAESHHIPVWQPDRLRRQAEFWEILRATKADVFVVIAYGQILPQAVLDIPRFGCINVHGSLLPKYRGAAPIQWSITNGETVTGITTMLMDAGVDTGAMLLKLEETITPADNYYTLAPRLAQSGASLLLETLQQLPSLTPVPQNHNEATYAPLIRKEDWQLDWSQAARQLQGRIRGFYPDCFTQLRGVRLKIMESVCDPVFIPDMDSTDREISPGTIVSILKDQGFVVQTGTEPLLIRSVQLAGKRIQSGGEFCHGMRLQVGEVLSGCQIDQI